MVHERLLVITTRGETIGTIIHDDGEETFLVEGEKVFPRDFEFATKASLTSARMGRPSIR